MSQLQRPVGVFWDLENVPIGRNQTGTDVVIALNDALSRYGRPIKIFAGANASLPAKKRVELERAGVVLFDITQDGRKDVGDKLLVARIFEFALDNRDGGTVVLVSGDVDFSIALSVLRMHAYKIVIVLPSHVDTRDELKKIAHHLYRIDDLLSPGAQLVVPALPVVVASPQTVSMQHSASAANSDDEDATPRRRTRDDDEESAQTLSSKGVENHLEDLVDVVAELRDQTVDGRVRIEQVQKLASERWPFLSNGAAVQQLVEAARKRGMVKLAKNNDAEWIELAELDEDSDDETDNAVPVATKQPHQIAGSALVSRALSNNNNNSNTAATNSAKPSLESVIDRVCEVLVPHKYFNINWIVKKYAAKFSRVFAEDLGDDASRFRFIINESQYGMARIRVAYRPKKGAIYGRI